MDEFSFAIMVLKLASAVTSPWESIHTLRKVQQRDSATDTWQIGPPLKRWKDWWSQFLLLSVVSNNLLTSKGEKWHSSESRKLWIFKSNIEVALNNKTIRSATGLRQVFLARRENTRWSSWFSSLIRKTYPNNVSPARIKMFLDSFTPLPKWTL